LGQQKGIEHWGRAIGRAILPPIALASIAFILALSGCHSKPDLTPQQAEGQHLYMVRCAHCHEDNDLALKPPPPNIHGAMGKAHLPSGAPATDAEVRRLVLVGIGKMPSFSGRFTEEQMAALLAYLHTDMPAPQQ
jgi:mono/diheme cytochrome c family protein